MDDATRRKLRFSMFLQAFALAMFVFTAGVQVATGTTSVFTWFFAVAIIALVFALVATGRQLRK